MKKYYAFIVCLILFSTIVILAQISTSKGPTEDRKTVQDLQTISYQVEDFARDKKRLPTSLTELSFKADVEKRILNYTYTSKTRSKYELCATFKTDASQKSSRGGTSKTISDAYYHQKGFRCFEVEVYFLEHPLPSSPQYR